MGQETICQNQFLDNLGVMIHKVFFLSAHTCSSKLLKNHFILKIYHAIV